MRGGILKVIRGQGIYVSFSAVTWVESHEKKQRIIDYWHSQGFAEAENLPYEFIDGYLNVTKDLPEFGFHKGSGTLDEQIYNIPF
ncbi:hypothetical protein [Calothrix sp. NIES-2098]|uniref:hypothetical protein n=1 Tax=Calothrix sp. NIES-2098 TaxID=1954171 RepID=UPI000B60F882|nr:hypothetical protein NIES2098_17630 [Calothrix sp. NIES-2098]